MGNKITICHWNEGGSWEALELPPQALEAQGHTNHSLDIWPPVEGVTPGMNWPKGEAIYLNGCVLAASTPSPEPSPSPSLPETGVDLSTVLLVLVLLIVLGITAMVLSLKRPRKKPPDG